jgi:hypothetical protein
MGAYKRFEHGECPRGCPRAHLEEFFAMLLEIAAAPNKATLRSSVRGFCFDYARDSIHPLAPDVLACLLEAPDFESKIREALQCKP